MISRCMKSDRPFGVVLIREGNEVGPATTYNTGTLAKVVDWYQGSDGILGITAMGGERFRLLAAERQDDGLNVGDVELLPDAPLSEVPDQYRSLPPIGDCTKTLSSGLMMPPGLRTVSQRSCPLIWSKSRNFWKAMMSRHS
jgi:hypothetical protein